MICSMNSLSLFTNYRTNFFSVIVNTQPAAVLIIRNGVDKIIKQSAHLMFLEQTKFEWDKKYWDTRRGKVLNKRARHNVCFGKKEQKPDYENKKGTIIPYSKVPLTKIWRNKLADFIGNKASNLENKPRRRRNKTIKKKEPKTEKVKQFLNSLEDMNKNDVQKQQPEKIPASQPRQTTQTLSLEQGT